ncbi:e3 ubiquitin-protein ligase sinat5 [Quercus suber]|uniref:E3 ubiquitin-protein ligase sinat5 n=1 Tax=Quercus suber TaxID=58331 RepID=A0AAW0KW81_QUESU
MRKLAILAFLWYFIRHLSIRDSHKIIRDRKELKLRITRRIWKEQQNIEGGVCIHAVCSCSISKSCCPLVSLMPAASLQYLSHTCNGIVA